MDINWDLVSRIAPPFVTLFLGRFLDKIFLKKPRLISYVGHVSAFEIPLPDKLLHVFSHAIVIKNVGRDSSRNIRIGHNKLPNYTLNPKVQHEVNTVPGGGVEIVIPVLVSGEQITISYLYMPPDTWGTINAYTKSDEGFAKIIHVIPSPLPNKWVLWAIYLLSGTGLLTATYFGFLLVTWLASIAP